MEFAADAPKPATGGEVTLLVDDRPVGKGRMDHTVPIRFSGYAGWISAATMAASSILAIRADKAVRLHRHDQAGRLRHQSASVGEEMHELHTVAHHGHTAHALRHDAGADAR